MCVLRVLIDSRLTPKVDGGVQQVIEGLAEGFAQLPETTTSFTFLTRHPAPAALVQRTSPRLSVREVPVDASGPSSLPRRVVRRLAPARALHRWVLAQRNPLPNAPFDEHEFDLAHLAVQHGFRTSLPYVYSPYDLQHLHLPELFTRSQRRARARIYGPLARGASAVVMHTAWNAADIRERFDLDPQKVFVVPLGVRPVVPLDPEHATSMRAQLGIAPRDYALYPAQTWPHKNHLALLACLANLRDEGVAIPVVCTGVRNSHYAKIEAEIADLGLDDLIHFTGYVPDEHLQALYAGARCLVFPSLFEGWGMPIFDALARGLPVAATNRCGLGDLLGSAAETFDPSDAAAMALAIRTIWLDEDRRGSTARAGRALASALTWERTCRALDAVYRFVGGFPTVDGDRDALLLASAWRSQP